MFTKIRCVSLANNTIQLLKAQKLKKTCNTSTLRSFICNQQQPQSTKKVCTLARCNILVDTSNIKKSVTLSRVIFTRTFQSVNNENKQCSNLIRQFEDSSSNHKSKHSWNLLNISAVSVIGSAVLFGVYNLFENLGVSLYPQAVLADSRNRNNFIADVVEKAAPAVVFLEIKGK